MSEKEQNYMQLINIFRLPKVKEDVMLVPSFLPVQQWLHDIEVAEEQKH